MNPLITGGRLAKRHLAVVKMDHGVVGAAGLPGHFEAHFTRSGERLESKGDEIRPSRGLKVSGELGIPQGERLGTVRIKAPAQTGRDEQEKPQTDSDCYATEIIHGPVNRDAPPKARCWVLSQVVF